MTRRTLRPFCNTSKIARVKGLQSISKQYYALIFEDFITQLKRREDLITAYEMLSRWETFQLLLRYQTHVHKEGWSAWVGENQPSNPLSQQLDIQAVKINSPNHRVYYSVYYGEEADWSQEVALGEQAGTTGKLKSIYGMRVRLDEAGSTEFNILYRMHKFDDTWTP